MARKSRSKDEDTGGKIFLGPIMDEDVTRLKVPIKAYKTDIEGKKETVIIDRSRYNHSTLAVYALTKDGKSFVRSLEPIATLLVSEVKTLVRTEKLNTRTSSYELA